MSCGVRVNVVRTDAERVQIIDASERIDQVDDWNVQASEHFRDPGEALAKSCHLMDGGHENHYRLRALPAACGNSELNRFSCMSDS